MDYFNLTKLSCREFAEQLSGKQPVPGGGGAAALVGAISISLGSMVGEYTIGKPKYKDVEPEIEELLKQAKALRIRLIELVEEDAAAFAPLSRAYQIPKEEPGRDKVLEEALLNAAKTPLRMAEACGEALKLIRRFQLKGSVMLLSDAGCGAALCRGALESACLNVFINTKSFKNRQLAEAMEREAEGYLKEYIPLSEQIVSEVMGKLRG